MYKLTIKNWLRQIKKILRSYLLTYIIGFVIIDFIFVDLIITYSELSVNFMQFYNYFLILTFLIFSYKIYFSKYPIYKMEAASLFNFFNTVYLKKILIIKKIIFTMYCMIFSAICAFCLAGFKINFSIIIPIILLISIYGFIASIISWIKYNTNSTKKTILFTFIWIFASVNIFLLSKYHSILLMVILSIILIIYEAKFVAINWIKYKNDLYFTTKCAAISSRNNPVEITELIEEARARNNKTTRGFLSLPLKYNNILAFKNFIYTYRINKKLLIIIVIIPLIFLLIKYIYINQLTTSTFEIINYIYIYLSIMAIIGVINIFTNSLKQILIKVRKGLLLPYNNREIIIQSSIIPGILSCLYLVIVLLSTHQVLYIILIGSLITLFFTVCSNIFTVLFPSKKMGFFILGNYIYLILLTLLILL